MCRAHPGRRRTARRPCAAPAPLRPRAAPGRLALLPPRTGPPWIRPQQMLLAALRQAARHDGGKPGRGQPERARWTPVPASRLPPRLALAGLALANRGRASRAAADPAPRMLVTERRPAAVVLVDAGRRRPQPRSLRPARTRRHHRAGHSTRSAGRRQPGGSRDRPALVPVSRRSVSRRSVTPRSLRRRRPLRQHSSLRWSSSRRPRSRPPAPPRFIRTARSPGPLARPGTARMATAVTAVTAARTASRGPAEGAGGAAAAAGARAAARALTARPLRPRTIAPNPTWPGIRRRRTRTARRGLRPAPRSVAGVAAGAGAVVTASQPPRP